MDTHIEATTRKYGFDFTDHPIAGRVLAICGVRVESSTIVACDPSCSWCARKLEEKTSGALLDRIAKS